MLKFFTKTMAVAVVCTGSVFGQMAHDGTSHSTVSRAIAVLRPTKGNAVSGTVRFETVENGIRIVADLSGLSRGKHGFHIHEFGDLTSDNGSSAGGHFNPAGMPHSMPSSDQRHMGDLGNIEADSLGNAHLEFIDRMMTFTGPNSVIGRGIVVHEKEDDLKTQPTGNAGARLAYGVIGIAR